MTHSQYDRWKQTQLAKPDSARMREELERAFAGNNDDYGCGAFCRAHPGRQAGRSRR